MAEENFIHTNMPLPLVDTHIIGDWRIEGGGFGFYFFLTDRLLLCIKIEINKCRNCQLYFYFYSYRLLKNVMRKF